MFIHGLQCRRSEDLRKKLPKKNVRTMELFTTAQEYARVDDRDRDRDDRDGHRGDRRDSRHDGRREDLDGTHHDDRPHKRRDRGYNDGRNHNRNQNGIYVNAVKSQKREADEE